MPEWNEIGIEDVLERGLRPVSAPEELWARVESASHGNSVRKNVRPARPLSMRLAWTVAASILAAGAAWTLHPRAESSIQSSSAAEIREWVMTRAALDVPLRDSSQVQLLGAHFINHAAEIAYRAGDAGGTLTVTRSLENTNTHAAAVSESRAKLLSWTMGGQVFTVACDDPDQVRLACMLCHS